MTEPSTAEVWTIVARDFYEYGAWSEGAVSGTGDQVEAHLRRLAGVCGDKRGAAGRVTCDRSDPRTVDVTLTLGETQGREWIASLVSVQELT